jgi:hypothetical protein
MRIDACRSIIMDTCTESVSAAWLIVARAVGLLSIDSARDSKLLLEDRVRGHAETYRRREDEFDATADRETAAARAAMQNSDRGRARRHVRNAQLARANAKKVRGLLSALEQQEHIMATTEINAELLSTWKDTAQAFTEWQRKHALDTDNVEHIRDELEVLFVSLALFFVARV